MIVIMTPLLHVALTVPHTPGAAVVRCVTVSKEVHLDMTLHVATIVHPIPQRHNSVYERSIIM